MEVLQSSTKDIIWHKMRTDLCRYVPAIAQSNLLMCCACARFLPFEHFSLEHIIPQQSLKDDPKKVRDRISANVRSGNILLCNKPLLCKGRTIHSGGCNSFKGKYYDSRLREVFNRRVFASSKFNSRHHISVFCAAYLAMVLEYGYQATLTQSGLLMRKQFFTPHNFHKDIPIRFRMFLMGENPTLYNDDDFGVWEKPFSLSVEENTCFIIMRGLLVTLPISRDPRIPIKNILPFAPSKYVLRPDFTTVFD